MSKKPEEPDDPRATATKSGIRWDAVAAIIASLVGLLALIIAGYTAHLQRQQVREQVWPYLIGGYSGARSELVWVNKGVGPAIVRTVVVKGNHKPLQNWKAVLRFLGMSAAAFNQSFLDGNVISPGETIQWIHFPKQTDYDKFWSEWNRRAIDVVICYCSTLGDCWTTHLGLPSRKAVAACPAVPKAERFTE